MIVTRKSKFSGKTNAREIAISQENLDKENFNGLSFYDATFIKNGMTPEEIDEDMENDGLSQSEKRYHR